jgi:hypothetical protein
MKVGGTYRGCESGFDDVLRRARYLAAGEGLGPIAWQSNACGLPRPG